MKITATKEHLDKIKETGTAILDGKGREILDPVPLTIHTELTRPLSLMEQLQRIRRAEALHKEMMEDETEDESNDFKVEDEPEMPLTSYEFDAMEAERPSTDVESISSINGSQPDLESGNRDEVDTGEAGTDDQPAE